MSNKKLNPCDCGEDIDVNFRVQQLWNGRRHDVYVAYCSYCNDCAPFVAENPVFDANEVIKHGYKAWNSVHGNDHNYHVGFFNLGFFNQIQTHDTKLTYGVYHVCDSKTGAIVAFATSKENVEMIVNALNKDR